MKILVAVDLSGATEAVMAQARQLALLAGAKLWLLHAALHHLVMGSVSEAVLCLTPGPREIVPIRTD